MFTNDWFSHNIPNWTKLLAEYKNKPALRFLEIGCYEGMATKWLCENILTADSSVIDVVDTFEGSIEHKDIARTDFSQVEANFRDNLKPHIESGKVQIHKSTSQRYLRELSGAIYDFVYIDGSHTSPDVLEDSVLSWRLVKPQSIIIWDDYKWKGYPDKPELNPQLAIDFYLAIMHGQYDLLLQEYQLAIRKIVG